MSFTEQHFCKKCRTCNTLTSTQPEIADENVASCQDSGGGACFGSGDAYSKDEGVDRTIPQQLNQMNLACPPLPQNVSSSGTPNTILSDSSTPRSDASTHYSDIQEKPSLRNDSLLQYLQLEQTTKAQQTLGQCLLDDRSVVGQEKSPISGTTSGTSVSTVDSSSHSSSTDLVPKERRRWVRPPLIGQAASSEVKIISDEFQPSNEEDSLLDDSKVNEFDVIDCSVASSEISGSKHEKLKSSSSNESANNSSVSRSMETGDSTDENFQQTSFQTSVDGEHGIFSDSFVCGKASPSSSVASHKRLEWDSGADVGYQDYQNPTEGGRTSILKLSAIERLALIQNTDKALRMRLDPEGTSGSVPSTGNNPTPTFNTYPVTLHHSIGLPSAESTPTERATCLKTQRKVSAGSIGISPITYVGSAQQGPSRNKPSDEKYKTVEETENISPRGQHVPRTRSASLLNLSTAVTDPSSYLYLYRSQSDPDVSADTGAHTDDSFTLKFTPTKSLKRKGLDSHSLSSGSENTLVHVPTGGSKDVGGRVTVDHTSRHETKEQIGHSKDLEEVLNTFKMPQTFASTSKGYTCSDKDHRHGLHHHYGILCSSCLMIPSELVAQNSSKQVGTLNPPESQSSSANSSHSSTSRSIQSESGDSTHYVKKKDSSQEKGPTQDRATSVSPPVDIMREDISAYVGKTTSFEYLPGRIYESELAAMKSNVPSEQNQDRQLSQLPSSDSSTVGSSQNSIKRQLSHHLKHKAGTTSSGDSEGALWSSPRPTSGTLVRDLERGVSLLRGLVHNNSAQREIVRRVVKRIVSSEYTDDLLERQLCRHNRRPFSGGHTFGTHKLPSLSDKTESEPRARSAPQRSTRRVQSSITLKAPFKKHVETCSQPSDTVSSGANDSSSLRSSGNESQKSITKESTLNQGTIQRVTDNPISEQQPPSLSSNSISKQPPNQPTKQSSDAASEQHANHSTKQSSPNPPSNHSSNQPSNYSSLCPAVATVPPKPLTTDASTATSQEIRTAVSYGTLSSVVSITPMTITVQSSPAPAVPLREVFTSELPVCVGTTKATVNASTMTTPPSSATGPRTAVAQPPPAASSKPVVPDMREVPESREQRRKEKSKNHERNPKS